MAVKKKATRRRERRTSDRVDARLSMRVEGPRETGDAAHVVTESQNISASGVYCTSSHYMPPLSKVQLTIVLPKLPGGRAAQELVKCDGIVVRCDSTAGRRNEPRWQLACMFSELDPRRRSLIEDFVTWRNLQALRAAARAAGAPRRKTTRRAAPATRKKAAVRRSTSTPAARAGRSTSPRVR